MHLGDRHQHELPQVLEALVVGSVGARQLQVGLCGWLTQQLGQGIVPLLEDNELGRPHHVAPWIQCPVEVGVDGGVQGVPHDVAELLVAVPQAEHPDHVVPQAPEVVSSWAAQELADPAVDVLVCPAEVPPAFLCCCIRLRVVQALDEPISRGDVSGQHLHGVEPHLVLLALVCRSDR